MCKLGQQHPRPATCSTTLAVRDDSLQSLGPDHGTAVLQSLGPDHGTAVLQSQASVPGTGGGGGGGGGMDHGTAVLQSLGLEGGGGGGWTMGLQYFSP